MLRSLTRGQVRNDDGYETLVSPITKALRNETTPASLEINARRLSSPTITSWTRLCKPRSARLRPCWTHRLDHKAKLRKRRLQGSKQYRQWARVIDRKIKREVQNNRRRLCQKLADELEGGNRSMTAPPFKNYCHWTEHSKLLLFR